MHKLLLTLFLLCSAVPTVEAQRVRTLEGVIQTPLKSIARTMCASKGGNLLLETQFTFYRCYFDTKIAQKQTKNKKA